MKLASEEGVGPALGLLLATSLIIGCTPERDALPADEEWTTLTSVRSARAVVERGLEALGGADAIERAGGLALDGEGFLDLGTLLQGNRPFEGDRHDVVERITLLPSGRVVHEERAPLNPDAWSWSRTDYRPEGTYRIDLESGNVSWSRPQSPEGIERRLPHRLLREALAEPAGLRSLGTVRVGGERREAVSWNADGRHPVTLLFDPESGLLRSVESVADLPVRGDSRVRWILLPYSEVDRLGPFPEGYRIEVDGELLREIRWTRRASAPEGGILSPPEGIDLPEPTPFADTGESGEEPVDIREVEPGVHLLLNLRTGFHMLFVELAEYVVAVDAPAGWWELQELPARDWAGVASPELGERYLEGIRTVAGDKPVRYVVLTHHHSDHMGGVRAFVEAGATVVGSPVTRSVVERTLESRLDLAGRSSAKAPAFEFETVVGELTIGDGAREMRILDVGDNPHSEGMLAVWLPGERILYVSDLFDPWGRNGSPPRQRIPVMRWFVDWLDGSGLEPERIYAIHGSLRVFDENLETIRALDRRESPRPDTDAR